MKKQLGILILLISSFHLYSQEVLSSKSSIGFGVNGAFFENSARGMNFYGEYSYQLNNYFAITPGFMAGTALYQKPQTYTSFSYLGSSVVFRITPFAKKFNRLKIDFGGFYQYLLESGGALSNEADQFSYYDINTGSFGKFNHFGLTSAVSINVIQNSKFEMGFSAQGYRYINWQLGTYSRNIGIYFRNNF